MARRIIVEQYVRLLAGDRVVDIGCGPAFFGAGEDTGFDQNPSYIQNGQGKVRRPRQVLSEWRGILG
jgi:hypothetical protein